MERAASHTHCRACSFALPPAFLDFGMQPLANNLCTEAKHSDERYPMRLARCEACGLLQLDTVIDPAVLFSHYLYTPSQSKKTLAHFKALADAATRRIAKPGRDSASHLAIDVGSNDGALLGFLADHEWCVIGVDPAKNLAAEANDKGLTTICDFFSDEAAAHIMSAYGTADLITACNVFAHSPDWRGFFDRATRLLAPNGLIAIEFPYGPTMLRDGTFDLCYWEHCSYPSLRAVDALLAPTPLRIVDAEMLPAIHGGSVRLWIGRGGEHRVRATVYALLADEETTCSVAACEQFARAVKHARRQFVDAIAAARAMGDEVIGYTAPAKAVTLIEFSGLNLGQISCIVDDNPLKQGHMLPGSHIPIVSAKERPITEHDTVVIFAWNVAEDIMTRLPSGARAIVPMPKVTVFGRR